MTRIKTTIQLAPYMKDLAPATVDAYQTSKTSRFAAAKVHSRTTSWDLRHVESGLSFGAILPPRSYTLAEVLGVIKALEAHTELDMSSFDGLEFGVGFTQDRKPSPATLEAIRDIARAAL